jgi:putative DNA primase/helicase
MRLDELVDRLEARKSGEGWIALCPAHDDHSPSLSIAEGADGRILLKCHAGCTIEAICAGLEIKVQDLMPEKKRERRTGVMVETYPYRDYDGKLLYEVVRYRDPKDFKQRRPDGKSGWIWDTKGVPRVLYGLPELRRAIEAGETILFVEGEKDVATARALGFAATTNPGGAGKWQPEWSASLADAHVVIFPDNDAKGQEHASRVAGALVGIAASVRMGTIPKGKDLSEWNPTRAELDAAIEGATAPTPPEPRKETHTVPAAPIPAAQAILRNLWRSNDFPTLFWWGETWIAWVDGAWQEAEAWIVREALYRWLHEGIAPDGKPAAANRRRLDDILDALKAVSFLPANIPNPSWLSLADDRPTAEDAGAWVSLANGVLNMETGEFHPPSPRFFSRTCLPFSYDSKAPAPARFHQFLEELFGADQTAKDLLQEWFGYLLTADMRQQKILFLIGPPRAGKGTLAALMSELVGSDAYANPSFGEMAERFALSTLIGKRLAVVSDARLSSRTDQAEVIGYLLRVSGQDPVYIDRKNRQPLPAVRLETRFVLLANEMPRFIDASGALVSRLLVIPLTESWLGREDTTLIEKLKAELPGILLWAREGLLRLRARGRFIETPSGEGAKRDLAHLISPIRAFLDARCAISPNAEVEVAVLYEAFRMWCESQGAKSHIPNAAWFSRDLHAALPGLRTIRKQVGHDRRYYFRGVGLSESVPRDEADWSAENEVAGQNDPPDLPF